MTRLVKPLVYILGFSVFCACSTSRPVTLRPGDRPKDVNLVLLDGTPLHLAHATSESESLRGLIGSDDAHRLGHVFRTWNSEPRGATTDGSQTRWSSFEVLIPQSEIREMSADSRSALVSAILVVSLVALIAAGASSMAKDDWHILEPKKPQ